MEVWNASSKAIASYSTLPQNWFNQEWLDINRSDSHIRVLIEPWRNGVSTIHLAGKRLNRAYAESCASPSSAHHFFDIHLNLVAMISSVTSLFTGWRFLSMANTYTIPTPECECTSCCPYSISSYPWMTSASFNSFRIRPTALVPSWYWNLPHRWRH